MSDSILTKVLNEVAATSNYVASETRFVALLPQIEQLLNKRVIYYIASEVGSGIESMINDEDAFLIENLLSTPSQLRDLVLILHSNGGMAISAERIIDICKNYCKNKNDDSQFYVVVPKRAKSAATILALGADKIFLCNTAELGPVDPQISVTSQNGKTSFVPAYLLVDGMENLLGGYNFKSLFNKPFANLPKEIKIKIFEQCNYTLYVTAKNELDLSESIIEKIAAKKSNINPRIDKKHFDIFRDPHLTKSHGRLINIEDLNQNPLCKEGVVCSIDKLAETLEDPATFDIENFTNLLWEFYVRKKRLLNDTGNNIVKTIEASGERFTISGSKYGQS